MTGINRLKSGNALLDSKLNYFVEYFKFCNVTFGLLYDMELDNPISIIDRVIFQLEYNSKDQRCINYLDLHFSKLLRVYGKYLSTYDTYNNVKAFIDSYNLQPKAREKYALITVNVSQVVTNFVSLNAQLTKEMVDKSIEEIISFIACEHPLNKHSSELRFHTKLLASELLFIRKGKKETENLFSDIFTSNYKKFPYPEAITTDTQKKEFFEKAGIKTRLRAISSLVREKQQFSNILFKIRGLKLPQDYIFTHNGNKILSPQNEILKGLEKHLKKMDRELLSRHFLNDEFAFCIVETNFHNLSIAHPEAMAKASVTVDFMNAILDRTYQIDTKAYLYTNNFKNYGYHVTGDRSIQILDAQDISIIEDNAYNFFYKKDIQTANYFLSYEPTFLKARLDRSVAQLWHYIEILLQSDDSFIKEVVALALLTSEQKHRSRRIRTHLRNNIRYCALNGIDINIDREELRKYADGKEELEHAAKLIKSASFTYMLELTNKRMTKERYRLVYEAYFSILTEAYEQRNMIQHSGIYQERAGIKLYNSFLDMIVRFRWVLFDYMSQYPSNTMGAILTKIRADGRVLMN